MRTFRKSVSLTLCFSGICLLVSSIVLCFAPPSHVGHFCPWRFLWLSRCQWNGLHIMTGLLFSFLLFPHVWFNRKPIWNYLKAKKRKGRFNVSLSLVLSLLVTVYVCVGTIMSYPPMKQISQGLRSIKMEDVREYGSPPYGSAGKAPIASIIMYMGWDVEVSLKVLKENQIKVSSPRQSVRDILLQNDISMGNLMDSLYNASISCSSEPLLPNLK